MIVEPIPSLAPFCEYLRIIVILIIVKTLLETAEYRLQSSKWEINYIKHVSLLEHLEKEQRRWPSRSTTSSHRQAKAWHVMQLWKQPKDLKKPQQEG